MAIMSSRRKLTLGKESGPPPGFTLLEVLISIGILGITALSIFCIHTSTWMRVTKSNRMMIAGQLIEKQIEQLRMNIAIDSSANWPPVNGTTSSNGVTLNWTISSAYRPLGAAGVSITNVRRCDLSAYWGKGAGDTIVVTTYLSKMF